MKTSTLPPVRVADDLRAAAERVLNDGETLSSFIESAVRSAVEYRRVQTEFHARGQAAWEEYQRTGVSYSTEVVVAKLRQMTAERRAQIESEIE